MDDADKETGQATDVVEYLVELDDEKMCSALERFDRGSRIFSPRPELPNNSGHPTPVTTPRHTASSGDPWDDFGGFCRKYEGVSWTIIRLSPEFW